MEKKKQSQNEYMCVTVSGKVACDKLGYEYCEDGYTCCGGRFCPAGAKCCGGSKCCVGDCCGNDCCYAA